MPPRDHLSTGQHEAAGDHTGCSGEATRAIIALRAYQIWQARGCPPGTGVADWLQAQAEIRNEQQNVSVHEIPPEALLSAFQDHLVTAERVRVASVVLMTVLIALAGEPSLALKLTGLFGVGSAVQDTTIGAAFFLAWNPLIAFGLLLLCYLSLRRAFDDIDTAAAPSDCIELPRVMAALMFGPQGEDEDIASLFHRAWNRLRKVAGCVKSAWQGSLSGAWNAIKRMPVGSTLKKIGLLFAIALPYAGYLVFVWGAFMLYGRTGAKPRMPFVPLALQPSKWFRSEHLFTSFDSPEADLGASLPVGFVLIYIALGVIAAALCCIEVRRWWVLWKKGRPSNSPPPPAPHA